MDYLSSGVDIKEGEKLVQWLKKKQSTSSFNSRVISGIGSYSGLFQIVFPNMKEPCLAASTDGVGTKLKLAVYFQRYQEVGQDLVAMCVNDLICSGATPLFFMDYYACGKLRQKQAQEFLQGVQEACKQSNCVLLGGETAEMPDCYTDLNFDCAGFSVGVVDKHKRLGAHKVKIGDRLLGVSSSGFHSNGFSFLRKVFKKDLSQWKSQLLEPTALYITLAVELFKLEGLKAIAHITGGGIDNILRVLPQYTKAELNMWTIPPMFLEVQKRTGISKIELLKTLNCGIGLVVVVSDSEFKKTQELINKKGFLAIDLGHVKPHKVATPLWQIV